MKTVIVSYSLTGNNEALANSVAKELKINHIINLESKKRNIGTTMLDLIFNRTPKSKVQLEEIKKYDLIILCGPVWMGQVATPLRWLLKYIKDNSIKYVFISISGGALNPNPNIPSELTKRAGAEPVAVIDQHIAQLLPTNPKPTTKDTSTYKITDSDIKKLASNVVTLLKGIL